MTRAHFHVISLPRTGFFICPASRDCLRLCVSHRFPRVPCQSKNGYISTSQLVQTFQPFFQSLFNLHPPSSQSGEAAKPIYNLSTHHTRLCQDLARATGPVGKAWSHATQCLQSLARASSQLSFVILTCVDFVVVSLRWDHAVCEAVRKQVSLCPSQDGLRRRGPRCKCPRHTGHLTVLGTHAFLSRFSALHLLSLCLECPSSNLSQPAAA